MKVSTIKKLSRKSLSVFLAVLMLMSTMSVSFGTFALAAGGTVSDYSTLANALNKDSVKGATWTRNPNAYIVNDSDGSVLEAVEAYWSVFNTLANKSPATGNPNSESNSTGSNEGNRTINQVNDTIKAGVKAVLRGDYTPEIATFLDNLKAGADVPSGTGDVQTKGGEENNDKTVPGSNIDAVSPVTITVMLGLTSYTLDNLPPSVVTSKTYTITHANDKYDYTYSTSSRTVTENCKDVTKTTYTRTYKYFYYISGTSVANGDAIDTSALITAKNTLTANAAYFSMSLDDLVKEKPETLAAVNSAVTSTKASVVADFGDATWKHFFGTTYDVDTLSKNISLATEIIDLAGISSTLNGLKNTGYDHIITDEAALRTLHGQLTSNLATYKAGSDDARAYIEADKYSGLSFNPADIQTFADQVLAEIKLIELRRLKATIDSTIPAYEAYDEDQVIGGTLKGATIATAKGTVDGYITSINSYPSNLVSKVMDGYSVMLSELSSDLAYLIKTANYNDQFSAQYAKYIAEIFSATDPGASSEALVAALRGGYDAWYTGLKNLIASIETDLEPGTADKILQENDDAMKARMEQTYATLYARVETEIDNATMLYNSVKALNGKITVLTASKYADYKRAFENLDRATYTYLKDEAKNFKMPQETIDKFNALSNDFSIYENFIATGGFSTFQQIITNYVDRDVLPNDVARDKLFDVNGTTAAQLITALDTAITSDDVSALLGDLLAGDAEEGAADFNIGNMLKDLIGEMLFSDALINTVVQMLSSLLLETLAGTWLNDLPTEVDIVGKVTYDKTLKQVASDVKLALYPDLLATYLDSGKYADNIAKLNAAANNFNSEFGVTSSADQKLHFTYVYDSDGKKVMDKSSWDSKHLVDEEGNLTLTWGVDAAKEAGKTGDELAQIFYNAFDDATAGLRPLFKVLLGNYTYDASSPNVAHVSFLGQKNASLNITANGVKGYANLVVPIFEALNVPFTKVSDIEGSYLNDANSTAKMLEAIIDPIFTLCDQIADAPFSKITEILPNLCYALLMQTVPKLLGTIQTNIHYAASVNIGCDIDAASGDFPINLGEMFDINELIDLSGGINSLLELLGLPLPEIDQGNVAQMGKLTQKSTQRGAYAYTGLEGTGKAYFIEADKGSVIYYLLQYIFGILEDEEAFRGLLAMLMTKELEDGTTVPDEEKINETITSFNELGLFKHGKDLAIAAVIELFAPQAYENAHLTDWYKSTLNPTLGTEPAPFTTVYLKYSNDWTEQKSKDLIDNLSELLAPVLEMAGAEETDINALIQKAINDALTGAFTNETVTSIVLAMAGMGASEMDPALADLLGGVLEADFAGMYKAFGYLLPVEEPAEGEEPAPVPLKPGEEGYDNKTGITASVDAEGNITWTIDGTEFVDGDRDTFFKLVLRALGAFVPTIHKLVSGGEISALDAINIDCAGVYTSSLQILLGDVLGIDIPSEAELAAEKPEEALLMLVDSIFSWIDGVFAEGEDSIVALLELVPNLLYFIESNGLSVVIRNLLHPILVLIDTVRPIADIDINGTLSYIVNELVSGKEFSLEMDTFLPMLLSGEFPVPEDPENAVTIYLSEIKLSTILKIVDKALGTNLYGSPLRAPGLDAMFAYTAPYTYANGDEGYKATISVYDAVTVLVSALIETLQTPLADGSEETNADAIFALIEDPAIGETVATILSLITGFEYTYTEPDWDYLVDENTALSGVGPVPSIEYLDYKATDWTEEKAQSVYGALDEILVMVLPEILKDSGAENLADFVNDMLTESVFTDDNLKMIVEGIANLLVDIDADLFELLDVMLDTDISAWFSEDMVKLNEETGKYECVKDWGVAEAADKKATFVNALLELLESAEPLLAFLLFGDSYEFFTGSKQKDNEYVHNSIITLNGGEGYERGIVPIFEALGFEMKSADEYLGADGKYDVTAAVEDILNHIFGLIDTLENAESTVKVVFDLLPNLIYFINADGLKSSVNNILSPIDTLIGKLAPMIPDLEGKTSLGEIIGEIAIGETATLDITELTTENLLAIAAAQGVKLSDGDLVKLITELYVGEFEEFESANGLTAYRLDVEGYEYHVLTIVLSLALDIVKQNDELFTELLGADIYAIINALLTPYTVNYQDIDWGYMYEKGSVEADNEALAAAGKFKPVEKFQYLKYATDWSPEMANDVYAKLNDVIAYALGEFAGESSIAALLQGVMEDNVYTEANLKIVVELIVNALNGFDRTLADTIGVLLDADVSSWFGYCEDGVDENGNPKLVCTKVWGVDDAADKKTVFVNAIKEILQPANRLLNWLFFEGTFTFFKSATGETLITINGGKGYDEALVPIFEALGCEVQPASAYYDDETKTYNVADAVAGLLDSALALVDKVSENPAKEVMALIPNLLYFINSDGLVASVNNLLAPVEALFGVIAPLIPEIGDADTLAELLNGLVGIEISNLNTETLLALLESETVGLVMNDEMKTVIKNIFALGTADDFESANGEVAYRVDVTDKEYDVLTVLLSFAIDAFKLNKALFAGLLPEGIYDVIVELIAGFNLTVAEINWAYMHSGNMDELERSGFPATKLAYLEYATDWTEEVADSVYTVLDEILELVLPSLVEDGDLKALVEDLIAGNLYKTENLETIVELIVNLLADFDVSLRNVVDAVLDVNIADWFAMCEENADGKWEVIPGTLSGDNKEDFIAGLKTVLEPANGLLSWLFFGTSYTFFNGTTSEILITVNGGEGYANGLVPILEALGLEMKPAEAYKTADGKYNVGAAVEDIINAVLTIVDKLGAAESTVEYVFTLLPNLLYFINADGLNACVSNLVAPVDAIIGALSDVVGAKNIAALLTETIGFDISKLGTSDLLGLLEEKTGIVMNAEMKDVIYQIYAVGDAQKFTSANGKTAYAIDPDMGDVLTVVLSFALDAFNLNEALFAGLLGEEEYKAVYNLIRGAKEQFVYAEPNWGYMYEGGTEELAANSGKLPKYPENSTAATYLLYKNNWNKETAVYVNEVVDAVVAGIMGETSLGQMLDNAITNGFYKDDILNSLISMVVGFVVDYAEIIEGAGVLLGAESIYKWFDYCTVAADGTVTVTHDFGVDEAATNDEKRDIFVKAFVDVLEPAYGLLAWLLFDQDFTFFNGTTNDPLITLTGGRGYEEALVPLFEAVGAKMPGLEDKKYENGETAMRPAAYYELRDEATGEITGYNMEAVVRDLFSALTGWLYMLCGNLESQGEYGVIGAMLDLLPNVVYNINAGTVKAVVNNLLLPVEEILGHLEVFGLTVDFSTLLEIRGRVLDITDLDWYSVFDILESFGLYWPENIQDFLATLYIGEAVEFESANGKTAYYMTYNADDEGDYLVSGREDMITLLISFVIDGVLDKRNAPRLSGWLGADVYNVIYSYLANEIVKVPMQDVDWQLTEYADTGAVVSPLTLGAVINSEFYGELYTREMGEYIEKWLPSFVDSMIVLLGVQSADGTNYEGLSDILNELIGTSLYTKENLDKILELVQGLIPMAEEALGAELFEVVVNVLDKALDVDLTYWNDYTVADIATGDREAFVDELTRMFAPLYPILSWLLTDEDLVALFYTAEGRDAVVIEGAEGYAYGIIPLLEAFDYDSERILTPEEFKAASTDAPTMLKNILNPVLDVVDAVLADPVNEIFNVLPGVIYFLNSNGLDTVIKNTANAVFTVLENIEPITGEIDIYELIGFNAENINIETLISELIKGLEEDTGFQLTDVAMDALKELTVGTVISYASKNGKTAYTVEYATGADRVDMVTVVLRTVLTFVSIDTNVVALEGMLAGKLDEEGYKFLCSLLENFSQMAASEGGMDEIMYTVYQIFYAANVAAHSTENWLAEFNGDYSFLNQLFATSDLDFLRQLEISLGDLLNKYTGDIIDDNEIVPNGFIAFFQKILEFFQKIGDFIKNLFK